MTTLTDLRLQARLAARLHDPPEKSLVLMRTRDGHEGGTVRELLGQLFPQGVPREIERACEQADHWASAADRMAFPNAEADRRYPSWQQVRFADEPVLIHPLTGQAHRLNPLSDDVQAAQAQALGTDHLRSHLQHRDDGGLDWQRSALALWRFGPQLKGELATLWSLLPADSRVPDHTIHDHLDLTAALASCFVDPADDGPALMAVSLGPVQDFIAAARSVSDLWAGSHLLSHLAWVAMRVVCEALGPEAVLFPRLRGVPVVDLWLLREQRLPAQWFEHLPWRTIQTDANPLFVAALPNRFTALVPAKQVSDLADRITTAVRQEALTLAKRAFQRLLQAAGETDAPHLYGYEQIKRQLQGFPEVHWAAVPWTLAQGEVQNGRVLASDQRLAEAMQPFFDGGANKPGFLGSPTWQHLSGGYALESGWFFRPNPGALYPALHELLDRVLAAAKTVRPFAATRESGWRCSLTGEAEWIATDAQHCALPPGQRTHTVWSKVKNRFGIRDGEHLSALPMLKRLWPTLFAEDVRSHVRDENLQRYVVSTHTMALAAAIERAVELGKTPPAGVQGTPVALPARLAARLRATNDTMMAWAQVPDWLESLGDDDAAARQALHACLGTKPDTYYGLLLMDGDNMGAWLSAGSEFTPKVGESFHPKLRERLQQRFGVDERFQAYAASRRAANPAWHMAISQALNHFAIELAPTVVERLHLGKLIYAGGDDVMAMLSCGDLLNAAAQLRAAYSGIDPEDVGGTVGVGRRWQRSGNGWAQFDGRVLRLMGERATASAGLVIAHHQAPLGAVLRALRQAERQAKKLPGKNAWSLAILKRGGGALYVTAHWGEPLRLFEDLRAFFQRDDVSRRAAYHITEWLHDVPATDSALVQHLLTHQIKRQAKDAAQALVPDLVRRLVELAYDDAQRPQGEAALPWLAHFMMAAEFLAREVRGAKSAAQPQGEAA